MGERGGLEKRRWGTMGGLAQPYLGASERDKGLKRSSVYWRVRRWSGRWRLEAQQKGGYSLGGAGARVEVGGGASSSVPSQFSGAREPEPGVVLGPGVWVGPGVGAEAGPGRWGLFMCWAAGPVYGCPWGWLFCLGRRIGHLLVIL